jgi:hypothetical protein
MQKLEDRIPVHSLPLTSDRTDAWQPEPIATASQESVLQSEQPVR